MWSKEEIARVCGEQTVWYQDVTWPGAFAIAGVAFAVVFFVLAMVRSA